MKKLLDIDTETRGLKEKSKVTIITRNPPVDWYYTGEFRLAKTNEYRAGFEGARVVPVAGPSMSKVWIIKIMPGLNRLRRARMRMHACVNAVRVAEGRSFV